MFKISGSPSLCVKSLDIPQDIKQILTVNYRAKKKALVTNDVHFWPTECTSTHEPFISVTHLCLD